MNRNSKAIMVILLIINIAVIGLLCFFIGIHYNKLRFTKRNPAIDIDFSFMDNKPLEAENHQQIVEGDGNSLGEALVGLLTISFPSLDGVAPLLPDNSELGGQWHFYYDIGDLLANEVGLDADDVSFVVRVNLEFNSDGTLYAYADEGSVNDGIEDFVNESMDAVYAFVASYGISRGQADFLVGITYGGDWGAFIRSNFGDLIAEEVSESQLHLEYKIVGNKIYVWAKGRQRDDDNYAVYEFEGNKLILTKLPEEFLQMLPGAETPIELER